MAEEPEQVLEEVGLPPEGAWKNEVCAVRSSPTIRRTAARTGAASTIRPDVERAPQQKMGSRPQVNPGARIVTIVAIRLSPRSVIETPTRMKKMMYESIPMFAWSLSGP
jgi:hypothetical protein